MIRHVVFIKFKPEAPNPEREAVIRELRSLPELIDEIREFDVGEDILGSARSWDVVIVSTFENLDSLKTYSDHSEHVRVVKLLAAILDSVGSVDYEMR